MKPARTRFAPSPTGFLHVGGVRTALFNYFWAKKTGGQFILRLEDTDRERYVAEGVGQIVESLEWLGLQPDEGFWISEGQHQNIEYVQSERHKKDSYRQYAKSLVAKGIAYYSVATPEDLDALRAKARQEKRAFVYRFGDHAEDSTQQPAEKSYCIRFHAKKFFKESGVPAKYPFHFGFLETSDEHYPQDYSVKWRTEYGVSSMEWNSANMEDFILIKTDSFPTYNFANVVDDIAMQITHVMRGNEFVSSTYKHIALYAALDTPEDQIPVFVHLPVINGADGKKLSKRTGDTNTLEYRDKGYLPEALLNFLALLGWNDGTEQEIYGLDELMGKFDLKDINSSPAVFDQRRLDWMNGYWIREKIELDDLYSRSKEFWPPEAGEYDDEYKTRVLDVVRERLKYFAELPELTQFFFMDLPINNELIETHKQLKKLSKMELRELLEQAKSSLEKSDFSIDDLTEQLNNLLDETGQKPAILFSLIRIATTQAPASPGLADTLTTLGKDRSLARIDEQLTALQ